MGFHENFNLDRFIAGGGGCDDTELGGGFGFAGDGCIGGGGVEAAGSLYIDTASSSRGSDRIFASANPQQPFGKYTDYSPSRSKNGDFVEMAANTMFPFTGAQWKELERQAMIYKYILASVPVPPDLLFPISRSFPDTSVTLASGAGGGGVYSARYSRNGDPEPGRCKRTDGKKWRCSRDVAPHQKYCERHLHRGRPRSRKHVEAKNKGETQKKARHEPNNLPAEHASSTAPPLSGAAFQHHLLHNTKTDPTPHKGTDRNSGLTVEGESEQEWQHLMGGHIGLANESSPIFSFNQDYADQPLLNLLSYSNPCYPEIGPLSGFFDAWSSDAASPMPGNSLDQEMRKLNVVASDARDRHSKYSSHVSWEPFASGGPLAEALQIGSVASGELNPASPTRSNGTLAATTVSSPSGVLHRTLFSLSDSSVCNSPMLAVPP